MSTETCAPATETGLLMNTLVRHCNQFKGGDTRRSIFQLTTTLGLFIMSCAAMVVSLNNDLVWPVVLLWLPTGGLLVRLFIIQHDCGHMSFFKTRAANNMIGCLLSVLTVTPYAYWRDAHNMHHAASGNLDRRGVGSIDTLTVEEYKKLPVKQRFLYRLYRHPLVLLLIGPPLHIMIIQRLPLPGTVSFYDEYRLVPYKTALKSIMALNIAMLAFYSGFAMFTSVGTMLMVFLMPTVIATWIGGWLFYIQHQFEDAYWEQNKEWNFQQAAVMGSSYYKLHPVLQWFTGNIGLHHIHHLCSLIPNYKLQECLDSSDVLKNLNVMTLRQSLRSIPLTLWDEKKKVMISFRQLAAQQV